MAPFFYTFLFTGPRESTLGSTENLYKDLCNSKNSFKCVNNLNLCYINIVNLIYIYIYIYILKSKGLIFKKCLKKYKKILIKF